MTIAHAFMGVGISDFAASEQGAVLRERRMP
jgi:hypothetical protein